MIHSSKTLTSKKFQPALLMAIVGGGIWFFLANDMISDGFKKSTVEGLSLTLLLGGFSLGLLWLSLLMWMAKVTLTDHSISHKTVWFATNTIPLDSIKRIEIKKVLINIFFPVTTCVVIYKTGEKEQAFGISTNCFRKKDVMDISKTLRELSEA